MNNQEKANEKPVKTLFIGKCWTYLNDNFHKFSQTNQIKIALDLCKKDVPQELTGSFQVTKMDNILLKDGTSLVFNIGSSPPPQTP